MSDQVENTEENNLPVNNLVDKEYLKTNLKNLYGLLREDDMSLEMVVGILSLKLDRAIAALRANNIQVDLTGLE